MTATMTTQASPPRIDVEALLQPISDDAPAGADPRADPSPVSPYYRIKDARNAARAAERQLALDPENASLAPDWRPVLDLAPQILSQHCKSLEIVAWYVEALIRSAGLPGLRDGFELAREMCTRFWDDLYPLPDEEGVATRVAPLTGLNGDDAEGTLVQPVRELQVTEGVSVGPFSAWQYEQALEVDRLTDEDARERRIAAGAVTLKEFQQAVAETPLDFYRQLRADLAEARDAYARLNALLDEKAGADAPPTSNLRNALAAFEETLGFVTRGLALGDDPAPIGADGDDAGDDDAPGASTEAAGGGPRPLRTREDAFRMLDEVAAFFRRTEPHSPVAYSLEQAVRWGRMPLPDLLSELVPDPGSLETIFKLTGIRPHGEET